MVFRCGVAISCALVLALGCGQSRRDAGGADIDPGGAAGTAGLDVQSAGAGADGGTAGAAATGGGGTSGGGATGDVSVSGSRNGGGDAGTLGDVGGGGAGAAAAGATAAGAAGQTAGGGMGDSGEGGAAGDGGHGGVPDVPGFDDLIVRSSLMAEWEGLTVYGTFDHNFGESSRSEPRSDVITDGSFELIWEQAFSRNSFGAYVTLFVDREGDGFCTGLDPAWSAFANNLSTPGTPQIDDDFDPALVDSTGPISCEEFNTWFDENFPGT